MAKITIYVENSTGPSFRIFLDRKKLGNIPIGKIKSFNISDGDHLLQLKQYPFYFSPVFKFALKDGEEINYHAKATHFNKFGGLYNLLLLLIFIITINGFFSDIISRNYKFLSIGIFIIVDLILGLCITKKYWIKIEKVGGFPNHSNY
jgi:hypothetical protein